MNFSKRSIEKIKTCEAQIQVLLEESIKNAPIDFAISCGHRTQEEQQKLFAQGRTEKGLIVTQIDGITKKSKHNYYPSKAFDIYIAEKGKEWDLKLIKSVASHIQLTAIRLNIPIKWGGNWTKFKDYPHFEL